MIFLKTQKGKLVVAFLVVFSVFFFAFSHKEESPSIISFDTEANIKNVPIVLGIADTEEERKMGLSLQKELKLNQGLLFLFEDTVPHSIWMKKMNFSIDVLWLSDTATILYIKEAFSPNSYPEVVSPNVPASMVLELPSGFVRRHQIEIGDQVIFSEKEL